MRWKHHMMPTLHRRALCCIAICTISSPLALAQDFSTPLPPAYGGEATLQQDYGQADGWVTGSLKSFQSGLDWEVIASSLYHSEDLGTTLTTYIYSTPDETFRYDYTSGAKSIGYLPQGVIDRDRFLTPRVGYELLQQQRPQKLGEADGSTITYTVSDPSIQTSGSLYIGFDTETNQIRWMETRNSDQSSRERFEYNEWDNIGDDFMIPTLIEFDSITAGKMRVRIDSAQLISPNPPAPRQVGDGHILHDFNKMQSFDSEGNSLGDLRRSGAPPSTKRFLTSDRVIMICGVGLIVFSGFLLARRKSGQSA